MESEDGSFRVRFKPDNVNIAAKAGDSLLEAAINAGIFLAASCGGAGVCGNCKVQILEGDVDFISNNHDLMPEERIQGYCLACQSRIKGDLVVFIPPASRQNRNLPFRENNELTGVIETGLELPIPASQSFGELPPPEVEDVETALPRSRPPITKYYVKLKPPSLEDNISDLSRLLNTMRQEYRVFNLTVNIDVVRTLPQILRESNWQVTVTTVVTAVNPTRDAHHRPRIIRVEVGDTRSQYYSLAFDIGTTTVVGQLLDLNTSKTIAQATSYNLQISYGQDVISRIAYCRKPGGLERLQKACVDTINDVLAKLLKYGVERESISHLVVAGNTTMVQILLGITPEYIRLAPYVPAVNLMPPAKAREIGIDVGQHVYLHCLPLVASYIGADIVSGVLASGMHVNDQLMLYIDIGTNGQIVLGNSEWMVTAACSAGPAFEGGGIKYGMIATDGAIEDFSINAETMAPVIATINNEKAKGICGSGMINIIAELFRSEIIAPNGKFNNETGTPYIRHGVDGWEYLLCPARETQIEQDIVITEIDIDNLLRAKAAIYAGCQTLAASVGISCSEMDEVIIAGTFGNYINIENAITIGLLPDIERTRFKYIGNGSLLGARMASFSTQMYDDARKVSLMMTNFELSENTDFMNNYMASLFLPHTNSQEFPSVGRNN